MKVVFLFILFIKTEKTTWKVFRHLLRCKDFRRLDHIMKVKMKEHEIGKKEYWKKVE